MFLGHFCFICVEKLDGFDGDPRYFEGVYHNSQMWLNGQPLGAAHENGYTSFWHRLDTAAGVKFGEGSANENVLAIYANGNPATGFWYDASATAVSDPVPRITSRRLRLR